MIAHPLAFVLVLSFAAQPARAQAAEPSAGLVAVHQALLDARSDVVVLNVAAHPDDESSRTNTMLRRRYGMRIVTAYSTYGDGGQNAIGREIGPALARIRVRETLRASAMMDVDVRWLGMPDFGFSKTLEETLATWGERTLVDAMRRVVDDVDPDVIITNHSLSRGHGHHRASIWAVIECLKERARDGRRVPQLYARCGVDQAQLVFDPAELDPARGQTFARLAHDAWTQHVSQGPWGPHDPLRVGQDYWRVVYPEGVTAEQARDLSRWARAPVAVERLDAGLLRRSPEEQRAEVEERLLVARRALGVAARAGDDLAAQRLRARARALQRLYLALRGVRVETWLDRDEVPLGGVGKGYVVVHGHEQTDALEIRCDGKAAQPVRLPVRQTPFDDLPRATGAAASSGEDGPGAQEPAPVAPVAQAPGPKAPPLPGRFEFSFACEYGRGAALPDGPEPSAVEVDVEFELDGVPIALTARHVYTPVLPIELRWDRDVVIVPSGVKSERLLSVSLQNHGRLTTDEGIRLQMGPGIVAEATPSRVALTAELQEARILVRAAIDADEMTPDAGLSIGFLDALVPLPLRVVDVTLPDGVNVALVRGPEDATEQALADLGVPFTTLDRDALVSTELEQFTAVLLDIRAYHHRPELAEVAERLRQYCRGGGRVVAMYHKPGEWNERDGRPLLAPFPLVVGNERCTEEDAAVTILQPAHRLMTHPHAIAAADFDGWVQERGLNFPRTWDDAWVPLLAMKDGGDEKPHEGALLYTSYGRGDFVYCSLSLYRQLRRGNPGAVRLLVNLLAR